MKTWFEAHKHSDDLVSSLTSRPEFILVEAPWWLLFLRAVTQWLSRKMPRRITSSIESFYAKRIHYQNIHIDWSKTVDRGRLFGEIIHKTPVRYLVYPDHVISKSDGQEHWIGARVLMNLYGVKPSQCVVVSVRQPCRFSLHEYYGLIPLRPQYDGDYTLPEKRWPHELSIFVSIDVTDP